jgi:hypothetical protein
MEARFLPAIVLMTLVVSMGASSRTPNFIVEAPTPELADKIGKQAEKYRRELAIEWLGSPMPNWSKPCPIVAEVAPHLGAGGATSFVFDRGEVFGWDMKIQGNEQRLLDSVLPHEVTHTIFASHFRQPLPRWADEGACTTVEHIAERTKQQQMLISFLKTQRGIAFHQMFAMKDYPRDVLPLYSQGYSLARFLIEQGGRHKFMEFVGDGLKNENWSETINKHYGYGNLAVLQEKWLAWVKQGSPPLDDGRASEVLASNNRAGSSADGIYRAQSEDRESGKPTELAMLTPPRRSLASPASQNASANDTSWSPTASGGSPGRSASEASVFDDPRSAVPARSAGSASRVSVYDRRASTTGVTTSNMPNSATAEPPITARQPERLAVNESAANSGNAGRRVLLEWSRPSGSDDTVRR